MNLLSKDADIREDVLRRSPSAWSVIRIAIIFFQICGRKRLSGQPARKETNASRLAYFPASVEEKYRRRVVNQFDLVRDWQHRVVPIPPKTARHLNILLPAHVGDN